MYSNGPSLRRRLTPTAAANSQNTLRGNVVYNLPRAAINFVRIPTGVCAATATSDSALDTQNDGFGGGNVVNENVIWNTCRESGDQCASLLVLSPLAAC